MDKTTDPIVNMVCEDLHRRSKFGLEKYGVDLARTDLDRLNWLIHAYHEMLDAANYLRRLIEDERGGYPLG